MGSDPYYSRAVISKRIFISSSTTSVPSATLNGLRPSSDCFSANSPLADQRAVLALHVDGHAHLVHLVLERDLHARVEAPSRAGDDVGGAQADLRVVRAVEQRSRQQVPARAIARALRHAGREIRRPPDSRKAGSSMVSSLTGNANLEARPRGSSVRNTSPSR